MKESIPVKFESNTQKIAVLVAAGALALAGAVAAEKAISNTHVDIVNSAVYNPEQAPGDK